MSSESLYSYETYCTLYGTLYTAHCTLYMETVHCTTDSEVAVLSFAEGLLMKGGVSTFRNFRRNVCKSVNKVFGRRMRFGPLVYELQAVRIYNERCPSFLSFCSFPVGVGELRITY